MNDLLMSEITSDSKSVLQKVLLIERIIFSITDETKSNNVLNNIVEQCQLALEEFDEPLEKAERMINELYVEHLLLEPKRDFWPLFAFKIEDALAYTMVSPVLKVILIRYIIEQCGFDTDIVFVPEKAMIRISCDDLYAIIFDPITGESLNWQELAIRLDEQDGDPNQQELHLINDDDLFFNYLTALKNALIKEKNFDKALVCVDILLALRPNDPFERRDRGFLLHQLDCFKVAYDDYRFFVEQCPKDPAAQLLKVQLDKINIFDAVLH